MAPAERRFNEAAGIHRRKPDDETEEDEIASAASMRPPEFTGGNNRQVEIWADHYNGLQ